MKNTFFNFRISTKELSIIHSVAQKLGFVSLAEFIRTAIREKIAREVKNAK